MSQSQAEIASQLADAGFSLRTVNALVNGMQLREINYLRTAEWGSTKASGGLKWELKSVPKLGPRGFAEVEAFRATGDARKIKPHDRTVISTSVDEETLAALDAWAHSHRFSRSEAVSSIIAIVLAESS